LSEAKFLEKGEGEEGGKFQIFHAKAES